jgi:hypothetical protein
LELDNLFADFPNAATAADTALMIRTNRFVFRLRTRGLPTRHDHFPTDGAHEHRGVADWRVTGSPSEKPDYVHEVSFFPELSVKEPIKILMKSIKIRMPNTPPVQSIKIPVPTLPT